MTKIKYLFLSKTKLNLNYQLLWKLWIFCKVYVWWWVRQSRVRVVLGHKWPGPGPETLPHISHWSQIPLTAACQHWAHQGPGGHGHIGHILFYTAMILSVCQWIFENWWGKKYKGTGVSNSNSKLSYPTFYFYSFACCNKLSGCLLAWKIY